MPPRACFIVGLAAEARLLTGKKILVGGGTAAGAARAAERAITDGATALVSFGLAGGLDPDLAAGAVVIPRFVRVDGDSYEADPALVRALGGATQKVLLAGTEIVASAAAKHLLWQSTGAAAVDLESGAVAEVATRRKVPFAALRAVCDPARRDLPPAALIPLRAGGRIALWRVLASVAMQPMQISLLMALARDAAAARQALAARIGAFGAP